MEPSNRQCILNNNNDNDGDNDDGIDSCSSNINENDNSKDLETLTFQYCNYMLRLIMNVTTIVVVMAFAVAAIKVMLSTLVRHAKQHWLPSDLMVVAPGKVGYKKDKNIATGMKSAQPSCEQNNSNKSRRQPFRNSTQQNIRSSKGVSSTKLFFLSFSSNDLFFQLQ